MMEPSQLYQLYRETTGVCTDTRKIVEHCMFFALKGDNFNGNNFAQSALDAGAKYVVVDDKLVYNIWKKSRGVSSVEDCYDTVGVEECESVCGIANSENGGDAKLDECCEGENVVDGGCDCSSASRMIYVEDVLTSLQGIARVHRKKFKVPVIALTGTNGKTTTKELLSRVLSTQYNVVATEGNLNNHIGVPLTLLRMSEQTQVAVIEMGASAPGEIDTLAHIVCPSFGLVTNVGKAHLAGFGSFEGVIKTKGELYDNLMNHRKIAFVNVDNKHLAAMLHERPTMQIVPYGLNNDGAKIVIKEGSPYLSMVINNPSIVDSSEPSKIEINTQLIGDYNADNVLAAICVATYFAVPTASAIEAIESYAPSNNRSQMRKSEHNMLIIDAYNANPTSMSASINNFTKLELPSKSLILGDMLELGADSLEEHSNILKLALAVGAENIYLVGGEFGAAYNSMCVNSGDITCEKAHSTVKLFNKVEELVEYLKQNSVKESTILIKGSRGIRLEKSLEAL